MRSGCRHLYALLQSNPLPREKWSEDPDEFDSLMKEYADMDDSTPTYRYCFVRVDNGCRYAYLTAGLPVKKGDHVRVPYGKKDELKEELFIPWVTIPVTLPHGRRRKPSACWRYSLSCKSP